MVLYHSLLCMLSLGLCPGEASQQRQPEPPAARPVKPVDPRLQALLDFMGACDREIAAMAAETARLEREAKALGDANHRMFARWEYELAAKKVVYFNSTFNSEVRTRTGFRLPSIKYWQLVSPRVDDPDASQVVKDANFLNDYADFKFVLSDIKFEFNVIYWTWTGKWMPNPEFLNATLHRLPGSE